MKTTSIKAILFDCGDTLVKPTSGDWLLPRYASIIELGLIIFYADIPGALAGLIRCCQLVPVVPPSPSSLP